jgi:hypothetical protein
MISVRKGFARDRAYKLNEPYLPGGDDLRKALQTANSCIKELAELSLSETAQPKSSTSKLPDFLSAAAVENNDKRNELMGNLIDILRRHLRVKYQLAFSEILQA